MVSHVITDYLWLYMLTCGVCLNEEEQEMDGILVSCAEVMALTRLNICCQTK